MSVPGVVVRDMEENFPFGRRSTRLRERKKHIRDDEVSHVIDLILAGAEEIPVYNIEELLEKKDNKSKALLMLYFYYPIKIASKKLDDPEAISLILTARIYFKILGLEKAAENLGKLLREIGRNLIGAIAEIADPEYALQAARAAMKIGEAINDELLKAIGSELSKALGSEGIEYELSEEEELEMKFILASTLISLGLLDEAERYIRDVEMPYGYFVRALIGLLKSDKTTRGESLGKLQEIESPETKILVEILEAIRKAYLEGKKVEIESIKEAISSVEDQEIREELRRIYEASLKLLEE